MKILSLLMIAGGCLLGPLGPVQARVAFEEETVAESRIELTTQPHELVPGQLYQIAWRAHVKGGPSIETDARMPMIWLKDDTGSRLYLQFLDEGEQPVGDISLWVRSGQGHDYRRQFYAPDGAKSFRLFVAPARDATLVVKKVVLAPLPTDQGGAINPDPRFEHGVLNPYGYQTGGGGGFYQRPDGVTVWKSGFTGTTPFFPVTGLSSYTFFCRGTGYWGEDNRRSVLQLQCFRKGETRPFHVIRLAYSPKGESVTVEIPADAHWANVLCYDVIIEEFAVRKAP